MNLKRALQFILGLILSGGVFIISVYVTDFLNDKLPLYLGVGLISVLGLQVQRKKIKPLTIGYLIGFIPIAITTVGFIIVSSLH